MQNEYSTKDPVIEINANSFKQINGKFYLKHKKFKNNFSLVKFYAPWCPHCKNMVDVMNAMAEALHEYNFKIFAVNCTKTKNGELAKKMGITGFPTLYLSDNKGLLEEYVDSNDPNKILTKICKFTNGKACKKN